MQRDSFSSREKSNGHTVNHTLKPATNIVQRTGDSASNLQGKASPQRKVTPERKRTPCRQSIESVNRAFQRSINKGPVRNGTLNAAKRASFDGRIRVESKAIDPCLAFKITTLLELLRTLIVSTVESTLKVSKDTLTDIQTCLQHTQE